MNTSVIAADNSITVAASVAPVATRRLDTKAVNSSELRFGSFIDSTIVGQENGRQAARRAFRRTLSKLRVGSKPYYTILAPGPTTCGKSEMAFRIGEYFHGSRKAVLKIDGSEYKEKHNLSKLTGASPNLVGYTNRQEKDYVAPRPDEIDSYAQFSQHNLTRSRLGSKAPVTVVLIDEWEKACREFNEILLSIFRDGSYTLGNGEVVDFSQCIFILTANVGSAAVEEAKNRKSIGFGSSKVVVTVADADKIISDHLRDFCPPEFRARIEENGEICIFHDLSDEQISAICDMKVRELVLNTEKVANIKVDVDEAARKWLLSVTGSVSKLNGGVQTFIVDELDNMLILGSVASGDVVQVTHVDGADGLAFDVEVKPLLLLSMAEMEAIIAEAPMPGKKDAVTLIGEAAAKAVAGAKGVAEVDGARDGAVAAVASTKPALLQPFKVVVVGTEETLEATNAAVRAAVKGLPHSLVLEYQNNAVEPFVGSINVLSTVEDMVALKARFNNLRVFIVGGELG
ncbi:ATP-dependent Clp protease ATP-binding subunit [bacterium]|nr:ATP-dependent Clp protease ATP-binding subunit [bacterium]